MAPALSQELYERATDVLAGGVSASMRQNPYLGHPLYIAKGDGPYLYGVDGQRYLDFNMSNGAALLGHNHPAVRQAVLRGLDAGVIAATETPFHEVLARELVDIVPAAERVRFSTVGTEVTIVALRIARHVTGREKYLKFDGHFHGLAEPWLYQREDPRVPDSEVRPSSAGVPVEEAAKAVMVPWNDFDAFERALNQHGDELAAVICEPIHLNAGCIPPEPGYLELLRARTEQHDVVLIFDEVLSGFRTALGGVQAEAGVTPDLTTHAKALANGLPLASLSGKAELMEVLAPTGPVGHSGTYSGHLFSVLGAIATLTELRRPGVYEQLNATASSFYRELQALFDRRGLPVRVQGRGARFGLYFGRRDPVRTYADALDHDHTLNARFNLACLERGVYLHPYTQRGAPGHAGFSFAHTDEDLDEALTIFDAVAADLSRPTSMH